MSYTASADNTITDNVSGLTWRRCSQGKNDDATCTGTALTYTWENALAQCESETEDYSDWRLPNVRELAGIMDFGRTAAPYINITDFPGTMGSYYWTSTTNAGMRTNAFLLLFNSGGTDNGAKTSSYYVRCVRGGP